VNDVDDRDPRAASGGRRPFVDLAPPTRARGDDALADLLFSALEAAADGVVEHDVPHGFHSWPAGMPPAVASTVLDAVADFDGQKGGVVVDPFSGGGTVGLEAVLHRRPFYGVDLNPMSARVGFVRTHRRSAGDADAFNAVIDAVVERSKQRVRERVRVRANVSDDVAAAYAPHVLLELAGLLEEVAAVDVDEHRKTLAVVFSSILTKVSQRQGDTSRSDDVGGGKRIGRFVTSEMFQRKAKELVQRQVNLFQRIGPAAPRPHFFVDDARALPAILRRASDRRAALVLTSPHYAGTYDYAHHHAHRLAWLGLSEGQEAGRFARNEIGARRHRERTAADFDDEMADVLNAIAASLSDDGLAVLLMGDGQVHGERIAADLQLQRLAPGAGLVLAAAASAPRPDWRGGPPREEHLVALRRRER
jgi:hypothetical protein